MCKVGKKIKIIEMSHLPIYNGRVGVIKRIEDNYRLYGTWGKLPINLSLDIIEYLD